MGDLDTGETLRPTDLDLGQTVRGFAPAQKVFNRYSLVRIVGRGGMGIVWLARDEELEREVALKFLPELMALDAQAVADLKRETKKSQELRHHHIVSVYDFVTDGHTACIALEYIDGQTVAAIKAAKKDNCLQPREIAPWIDQLCEALTYAHDKARVVHRDLKPANLMLTGRDELKVTDFGIARSVSDSASMLTAGRGFASGTLVYMSPQQLQGEQATALDDIYSTGATIYELLTGKPPFYSGQIDRQILEKIAPTMSARREELGVENFGPIPADWEDIVAACLAKNPAGRPQSADELAKRLRTTGKPSISRDKFPIGAAGRGTGTKKNRFSTAAVITGLLAVILAAAWFRQRQRSLPASRPAAVEENVVAQPAAAPSAASSATESASTTLPTEESQPRPSAAPRKLSGTDFSRAGMEAESNKDYAKAAQLYEQAALAGDAGGQLYLASLYERGLGVPKDMAKATQWYEAAAKQGDATALLMAGVAYLNGKGVPQDYGKAAQYYKQSADQGYAAGESCLGNLYATGRGVPKDMKVAIDLYKRAAEHGDATALLWLGQLYAAGKDVGKDEKQAVAFYQQAADAGEAKAQNNLAVIYATGDGVPKDREKAEQLFRLASAQGNPVATKNLDTLEHKGHNFSVYN